MHVKIMGPEGLPDEDPRKTFSVYSGICRATFRRDADGKASVEVYCSSDLEANVLDLSTTAYVMNEQGRTIATFNSRTTADGQTVEERRR
jgi:hypothetical protein